MTSPDIYVVAAARTAIGTFGGALKDVPLTELAATALRAAVQRSGIDPQSVGHVVFGNVGPSRATPTSRACPRSSPVCPTRRRRSMSVGSAVRDCKRLSRRRRRCCWATPRSRWAAVPRP